MSFPYLATYSPSFTSPEGVGEMKESDDLARALFALLSEPKLDSVEIAGALKQYAFRSVLENRRVRDWCSEVTDVLRQVSTGLFESEPPPG